MDPAPAPRALAAAAGPGAHAGGGAGLEEAALAADDAAEGAAAALPCPAGTRQNSSLTVMTSVSQCSESKTDSLDMSMKDHQLATNPTRCH